MNALQRAVLYQSHREARVKQKISSSFHRNARNDTTASRKQPGNQSSDDLARCSRSLPITSRRTLSLSRRSSSLHPTASIMSVTKSSREHDQWRLLMMLSSF